MKLFQKLSYASLVFPGAAAGMPIFIFILPYYAGDLGLGLSLVGVLFFLGRITDIFTDPVMGVLIDKYPSTKWGKHKHWILISAPILMLATYFIFIPTTANPSAFYFFASLLLLYTGFTL